MMRVFVFCVFSSLFLGVLFPSNHSFAAEACDLGQIDLVPWKANRFEKYVGSGKNIEMTFHNESAKSEDLYLDSVTLQNKKTQKSCLIDLSILDRQKVFLSADENTIVLGHSSGSKMGLSLYDTNTCKEKAALLFGPESTVDKNRITFNGTCEYTSQDRRFAYCLPAEVYDLDQSCHLKKIEKESRNLTKQIFGVSFTGYTAIEFPRTKKARVVKKVP